MTTREDTVSALLADLQRIEAERLEDEARAARLAREAAEAEALLARQVAEATAREESERNARAEAERCAREAREAAAAEARARATRVQQQEAAEAAHRARLEDLAATHDEALARVAARPRGVSAPVAVLFALGAAGLVAVAGWMGVIEPQRAAHARQVEAEVQRAERARAEADEATRTAAALALRPAPAAPAAVLPPPAAPAATAVAARGPRRAARPVTQATAAVVNPADGLDLDRGGNPFDTDDLGPQRRPNSPRR